MRGRIDIMTDIETLGKKHDSQIIQISAKAFDIKTGDILASFKEYVNILTNENKKSDRINVDASTLEWWLNTDKELLTELIKKGIEYGSSELDVMFRFVEWINYMSMGSDVFLWGNGILFDNAFLQAKSRQYDYAYPIPYKNDRDMRTIVDLYCQKFGLTEKDFKNEFTEMYKKENEFRQHDADDDVKLQIAIVSHCYRELIG